MGLNWRRWFRWLNAAPRIPVRTPRRKLWLEQLEDRLAPAAPVVGAISDLQVPYSAANASVTFSASDADSTLTAPGSFTVSYKTLTQAAYDLDSQLSLTRPASTDYGYNARGQQEKYIPSASGRWFYIKPDGGVYEILASTKYNINQSVFISRLDASYWTNPSLLHDAPASTSAGPALVSNIVAAGTNQYALILSNFSGFVG